MNSKTFALSIILATLVVACVKADTDANSYTGLVAYVGTSKTGNMFLDFDKHYPKQDFTGFIPSASVTDCGGAYFLKSLTGKQVKITGKIIDYKGKPEIILTQKNQIEVLN